MMRDIITLMEVSLLVPKFCKPRLRQVRARVKHRSVCEAIREGPQPSITVCSDSP